MGCCLTATTWNNVDFLLVKFCGIYLKAISQEIPQPSITKLSLKIAYLISLTSPGANELTQRPCLRARKHVWTHTGLMHWYDIAKPSTLCMEWLVGKWMSWTGDPSIFIFNFKVICSFKLELIMSLNYWMKIKTDYNQFIQNIHQLCITIFQILKGPQRLGNLSYSIAYPKCFLESLKHIKDSILNDIFWATLSMFINI